MSDASAKSSKKVNSVVNNKEAESEKMEYRIVCGGFNTTKENALEVVSPAEVGNIIPAFSSVGTYSRHNDVITVMNNKGDITRKVRVNNLRTVSQRIEKQTRQEAQR